MKAAVRAYDSAYPGSMCEREDGYYLCRNDHTSLAAALLELINSRDRELEDLRDALVEKTERGRLDLMAALRRIVEICASPPDFGDKTILDVACAALAKAGEKP